MPDYPVIDADGHVLELPDALRQHLEPRWRRPSLLPNDAWDRNLGGKLGQEPQGPQDQLAAMDQDGIDVMVMYPTLALGVGLHREVPFATAFARAYNDYLHEFCAANPSRLRFVAVIAPQDVQAAAKELRRAVTELGAVGAMLPTYVPLRPDWGDPHWDPIYAAGEDLDVGLGFHATLRESVGAERFNNFISVHTVAHPFEQIMALTTTVVGGVYERFKKLRVGFLEGGIGWVPYMMDRLDEEIEKRGEAEAPWLTKEPSEYIQSGRIFFGVECGEKTIPDAVRWGLEDLMLYSSDYPHWDGDWPHTVSKVRSRQDMSGPVRRKFLCENALRFYGPRLAAGIPSRKAAATGAR